MLTSPLRAYLISGGRRTRKRGRSGASLESDGAGASTGDGGPSAPTGAANR
jgi:hypothetical protein